MMNTQFYTISTLLYPKSLKTTTHFYLSESISSETVSPVT